MTQKRERKLRILMEALMLNKLRVAVAVITLGTAVLTLAGAVAPAVAGEDFCLFSRPLLGG
jgi:hypothetical protein